MQEGAGTTPPALVLQPKPCLTSALHRGTRQIKQSEPAPTWTKPSENFPPGWKYSGDCQRDCTFLVQPLWSAWLEPAAASRGAGSGVRGGDDAGQDLCVRHLSAASRGICTRLLLPDLLQRAVLCQTHSVFLGSGFLQDTCGGAAQCSGTGACRGGKVSLQELTLQSHVHQGDLKQQPTGSLQGELLAQAVRRAGSPLALFFTLWDPSKQKCTSLGQEVKQSALQVHPWSRWVLGPQHQEYLWSWSRPRP